MIAFWFRRDLRLEDNNGLFNALKMGIPVLPVFIFDSDILNKLEDRDDQRVKFIHDALAAMQGQLLNIGSALCVKAGRPVEVWKALIAEYDIEAVYTNHDYEPYAAERDSKVSQLLKEKGIAFNTFKDQVIFEKNEVIKDDGTPFVVFTPYSKKWKSLLKADSYDSYPVEKYFTNFLKCNPIETPSLESIGFRESKTVFTVATINEEVIKNYHHTRDIPSVTGTTRLSVHLRFGTISIRKLAKVAAATNEKYLNELIWREFYQMILWHFPKVAGHAFKPQYDKIAWRNDAEGFEQWCNGTTGVPIVDAGMRELNATGFMHNRVRMITASFLTKDLLIDWRWGEAYFARKLLDFDLASNNGGWQWAAGTGVDAAPYFRIFNPTLQALKFDPDGKYIRQWVPEFDSLTYNRPIIDHAFAKNRALKVYKEALSNIAG